MAVAELHIPAGPGSRILLFILPVLAACAAVIRFLHIRNLHTGFVVRLMKRITRIYKLSEEIKLSIKIYTPDEAFEAHQRARDSLKDFRFIYSKLEKVNFLDNPELQSLCDNTLDNFYSIESTVRRIAYSDKKSAASEDKELLQFSSDLSLSSIPS